MTKVELTKILKEVKDASKEKDVDMQSVLIAILITEIRLMRREIKGIEVNKNVWDE